MARSHILYVAFALTILTIVSCSGGDDVDVHSADFDKFTNVYAELAVGFELAGHDSTIYMPIRDSIFASLEVDSVWVDNYTAKLGDNPESWLKVWQEITRKLAARKDSITP